MTDCSGLSSGLSRLNRHDWPKPFRIGLALGLHTTIATTVTALSLAVAGPVRAEAGLTQATQTEPSVAEPSLSRSPNGKSYGPSLNPTTQTGPIVPGVWGASGWSRGDCQGSVCGLGLAPSRSWLAQADNQPNDQPIFPDIPRLPGDRPFRPNQPTSPQPIPDRLAPPSDRPTIDQPATDQPATDRPTTDQPTIDQPRNNSPTVSPPSQADTPSTPGTIAPGTITPGMIGTPTDPNRLTLPTPIGAPTDPNSPIAPPATVQTIPFPPNIPTDGNPLPANLGKLNAAGIPEALLAPPEEWRAYRLSTMDSVLVQVSNFPELSTSAQLNSEGMVVFPLLGRLKIEGLTVQELETVLKTAYNRLVVDPKVNVLLGATANSDVVIAGEVTKPGFYRVAAVATVTDAILAAGGAKDTSNLRAVRVRRMLPDSTVKEQTIDLLALLIDGTPEPRIYLQDGDTVFVPRRESGIDPSYDTALVARSNLAAVSIKVRILNYPRSALQIVTLPSGSKFVDIMPNVSMDLSRMSRMALIRYDPERGQPITQILDAKEAFVGDPTQNPQLMDGDVIVINRNLTAKLSYALTNFTQPIRSILGFLLFTREVQSGLDTVFGANGLPIFGGGSSGSGLRR